jgi:hypothetical protein
MSRDEEPADAGWLLDERDFRAALDALQDHVAIGRAIRGPDGTIEDFLLLYMNQPTIDGAGRRAGDLVGGRVRELFPAWEKLGFFDRFVQMVEHGEPIWVERFRYDDITPDGVPMGGWWSVRAARFGDGYISASRDVTSVVHDEIQRQAIDRETERTQLAVELLQRASLPAELPDGGRFEVGARYEPAMEGQSVGGDWFDAFLLDEHRLGLVIGDVSGHGSEAAVLMVQVRNAVRAFAFVHDDPAKVLNQADRLLSRTAEPHQFVTCAFGVLDARDRSWSWANAGHLPPLLIGGAPVLLDGETAPPLGVDPQKETVTQRRDLHPAEQVVLFTDGLVEVRRHALTSSLSALERDAVGLDGSHPQVIADTLVDRLIGRSDDVAVVAARLLPPGAG